MKDYLVKVAENSRVSKNAFKMVLRIPEQLPKILGGQFLHVEVPGFTLRRPFCISEYDEVKHTVSIVYAIVGAGTEAMSKIATGTMLKCIMPIGNGFSLLPEHKKVMLIGGGLGAAPLLPVAANCTDKSFFAYLGFNSKEDIILQNEFKAKAKLFVATVDGSFGKKGFVTDLVKPDIKVIMPDIVLVCGPTPMIKAVGELNFPCPVYVSLEARMGCGVGACLVCTCPVKKGETVNNVRVCVDGPVFELKDIVI